MADHLDSERGNEVLVNQGDEWAEILRFEQEKFEEEKKRKRDELEKRKKMIRETLSN